MDLQSNLGWDMVQANPRNEPKQVATSHCEENTLEKRAIQLRFQKIRVRIYFVLALGAAIASVVFYSITTTVGNIGLTIDPCDDFYEFSCHQWQEKHPRPDWALEWGTFDVLNNKTNNLVSEILKGPIEEHDITALKQAKYFYKMCLISESDDNSNSTLNFAWNTLESYGGWPILYENGTWNSINFNLIESIAALQNRFNFPILFRISSVQFSPTDPADNFIFITKPGSNIFMSREFVSDLLITWFARFFKDAGDELSDFILSLRNELSDFKQIKYATKIDLWSQIKDIMNNTIKFMNPTKNERSRDTRILFGFDKNEGQMNVKTLQTMVDFFVGTESKVNFRSLLEYIYEEVDVKIDDSLRLLVPDIEYVLDTCLQLEQRSVKSIANYLHFIATFQMASLGTGNLRRFYEKWWNALHYTERDRPPQRMVCSEETQNKFKFVVSHELVKQKYQDLESFRHVRKEVQNIFENVKISMLKHSVIVERRPWPIEACIGIPDWIFDTNAVQNEYFGLNLHSNQSYLEQTLVWNTWATNKALMLLKYPLDNKCKWKIFPGRAGAFVRNDQLLVYLPMGILQPPFFDINRSSVLNYGSLGVLIGHELTHAFSKSFWIAYRDRPISSFETCLKRQYSSFVKDGARIGISGDQTLSENLADNVGLREAYSAFFESLQNGFQRNNLYLDEMEDIELQTERSFFLSFAQIWCVSYMPEGLQEKIDRDTHSPGMFRALGALQNSKQFKKAWSCQKGSKMDPLYTGQQGCEIP